MEDVFPKYAQGSLEMQSNYGYFHNPRQFHTCCLGGTGGLNHSWPGLNLAEDQRYGCEDCESTSGWYREPNVLGAYQVQFGKFKGKTFNGWQRTALAMQLD